jgi:hypothetical protein
MLQSVAICSVPLLNLGLLLDAFASLLGGTETVNSPSLVNQSPGTLRGSPRTCRQ